jgi:glycosyltransferase involved in cell wall biosynthesis
LNGLTILRYGHVYDSGGGMEQYLTDLNRALHERNDCHTIQVQLTSDPKRVGESEAGRLKRVSLFVEQASHERAIGGRGEPRRWERIRAWGRDRVLFTPWVYRWITRPALARRPVPRRDGEPERAGETVRALHRLRPLDLICLHSAGGADVAEILAVAQAEGIPAVYVHHFANERLSSFSIRRQVECLQGVAGVCGVGVPRFLQGRFQNVSDGIDTDFFQRDSSEPSARRFSKPVIFLPARITPTKGQADLIRAAGELKRRGFDFQVVFAGRTDTPEFLAELRQLTDQEGLGNRVEFAGQLGAAELRGWYAAAAIVAFPTRHHEGLPRILLECQAMEVPPVVYDIGGTGTGIKNGETGILVALGDFAGLVDGLQELLRNRDRLLEMGRAGRRLVEDQFSLSALAERHERFYRQALTVQNRPGIKTA